MSDISSTRDIEVHVNGRSYRRTVDVRILLSDFLRHELGLTGTHVGCEHGVCGACTVLLDGRSIRSCLMFAVQTNERQLTTVEGLARGGELHLLQKAFSEEHGLQCGFCTPGMLTTLIELLNDNPLPTEDDIRDAISGNLCRCTGYDGIVKAVLRAATEMRSTGGGE
jgi:aerobic carbon-monoxide dehydrogenase small subunit